MISLILLILGLVCFGLAAVNVAAPRVSLGWLGLFFTTLASLLAGR